MSPWSDESLVEFKHDVSMFEQFLDVLPDAFIGVQNDGTITLTNELAEELFRMSRDDLIGAPIASLIPTRFRSEQLDEATGHFASRMDQPHGANIHMYLKRSDESEFAAEISLSSFLIKGETIEVAAIRNVSVRVRSETEHKRLEKELALNQSRRLESVGELAGGIAHDFNNLLSVIINYAELAEEAISDPEIEEDVVQIQESAHRAAALTRQLLIFSRREIVKPVAVALNDILADVEKLLRRTIGEQITLNTHFAPDLRAVVADPGQIEQIVMNLAVNARDAMPEGGLLEIETTNVLIDDGYLRERSDGPAPGKYVLMTVSDSGTGMSSEVLARAFEPFFTTKGRTEGTGLGLATVYGIVKQAEGDIFIYSEPGHGTAVKIYLKASDATVEEWTADQTTPPVSGAGQTILVVEDEAALRRLIERVLKEKGYSVLTRANAERALDVVEDDAIDIQLLLTDVVMPGMQGNELAELAHAIRPELKIILMSGYSEAIIARIDGHKGSFDLVDKPFTRAQLLNAVSTSLAKAQRVSTRR
jgi:PAS domain S-box-containing protein